MTIVTQFTIEPPIDIDPLEQRSIEVDLFGKCAQFWRANEVYSLGEFVWPERPNGFCFEKTSLGQQRSGARAPLWPAARGQTSPVGQTVKDGPIEWTCRDSALSGLNVLSSPTATSDPTGLAITVSVLEGSKLLVTYDPPAGAKDGDSYEAIIDFTLLAIPRRVRQLVKIMKR